MLVRTVDKLFSESKKRLHKLFSESKKRLQLYLKERMAALAEKSPMRSGKKHLEERQHDRDQLRLNLETLRAEQDLTRLRAFPSWPDLCRVLGARFLMADRPAVWRCPQKSQLPGLHEEPSSWSLQFHEVQDDRKAIKCGILAPSSPWSLQLNQLHKGALLATRTSRTCITQKACRMAVSNPSNS